MTEFSNTANTNAPYLMLGGLAVVVGVLCFMLVGAQMGGHHGKLEISIEAPSKVR